VFSVAQPQVKRQHQAGGSQREYPQDEGNAEIRVHQQQ
jgi:hypothetical protein